ncbi:18886_t:CDS:2, partial [Rhizophagus irregularis]
MPSQQIQSSKITKQNPRTNKMTKPTPKPLTQLVLNPVPIPPQNQMSSGFKMKFEYPLHKNSGIDNSFHEKLYQLTFWTRKLKVLMRKIQQKNVESQVVKRWSDEEIDILSSYLEDNYEKLQQ